MKKVLIISYYWPPSGGAGVQRWLKFVKYLRDFNWEPVIYTPENPETPETDESLFRDIPENMTVLKNRIWEPYLAYKKFMRRTGEEKIKAAFLNEQKSNPVMENISVWIRGNFFIPDARKFWIKPSVRYLGQYIEKNPVDLLISTGPPHSMHRIGMQVAAKYDLPWIADFRDPWTNIDFYKDLRLTKWADRKHRQQELEILKKATAVVTIGKSMAEDFNNIWNRKYDVITNGFDDDDIASSAKFSVDKKFSIAHVGSLVSSRNPLVLWETLKTIVDDDSNFSNDLEIKLAGRVDFSVLESIGKYGLSGYVNKTGYLPHSEVVRVQQQSQVLLLLINNTPNSKSILTGKFFEYLATGRPILCIGPPDGDAADILQETDAGLISNFNDLQKMKENILSYYQLYKEGKLRSSGTNIEKYSRRALTGKLNEVMSRVLLSNK
jgi:glycosyltransferase involved in cell wall biosynthesis